MRWEVVGWGALALLLFTAEALAPGAFARVRGKPMRRC
jgi:hypothetical protein